MEVDGAVIMEKRGIFGKGRIITLFILITTFLFVLNSSVADSPLGCCVEPRYANLICHDEQITQEECCGLPSPTNPNWGDCNETFVEETDCNDAEDCQEDYGCCIYEDECRTVLHALDCVSNENNTFIEGETNCNDFPQCNSGCCIYESNNITSCYYMQSVTCTNNYDIYAFNESMAEDHCVDAFCSGMSVGGTGRVFGYVYNGTTGNSLSGASIETGSFSTTSDGDGYFDITDIPNGDTTLTVSRAGFITAYEPIVVPVDDEIQLDIILMQSGTAIITGVVREGATELQGAVVWVHPGGDFDITSSIGTYRFDVAAPGTYRLTASKEFYTTVTVEGVEVVEADIEQVNIYLEPELPSNITGSVIYSDGSAFEDIAAVRIQYSDITTNSDGNGDYEINNLASGNYILYAEKSGYDSQYVSVDLPQNTLLENINIIIAVSGPGNNCSDVGGYCCANGYSCGNVYGITEDCNVGGNTGICCQEPCTALPPDTDGDQVADDSELCDWEEALIAPLCNNESWFNPGCDCDDGIDNDCDADGWANADLKITNSEDLLDSDCTYCPQDPCNYDINRWCNETRALELLGDGLNPDVNPYYDQVWVDYGGASQEYCDLCGTDSQCSNSCQAAGESCCYLCADELDELTEYDCSDGQKCCDNGCYLDYSYGCCEYDWSCNDIVSDDVHQGSCGSITACFTDCIIPNCILNTNISDIGNINPTGYLFQNNTVCWCGNEEYEFDTAWDGSQVDFNRADTGFCCELGGYMEDGDCPTPADTATVYGYVKDTDGDAVNGVDVNVADVSDISNVLGYYELLGVPFGTWTADVFKNGYIRNRTLITVGPGYNYYNFTLQEGVGCDYDDPPEIVDFSVTNVQGQRVLNLEWYSACADWVEVFYINKTIVGSGEVEKVIIFDNQETGYVDEDVMWDIDYEYTIWARYTVGLYGPRLTNGVTRNGNPGNPLCENKGLRDEFCLNTGYSFTPPPLTQGVYCDEFNQLENEINCTHPENGGESYVCVEFLGQASCMNAISCSYEGGEPFGLYHTAESCENDDNYCYYDYSNTTVDSCYNCDPDISCFGYRSEGACDEDRCDSAWSLEPYNEACTWYEYYGYPDFNEGVCFKPYYEETDQCGLCNKEENTPFDNPLCDYNVCSRLGMCYSDDNGDYCAECDESATCELYDDETSCNGIDKYSFSQTQDFEIPFFEQGWESYDYFDYSLDACELNRCKWGDPEHDGIPRCYKDGDGDSENDCRENSNIDRLCREDSEPPITTLTNNIPIINSNGHTLIFNIEGLGDDTVGMRFYNNIKIRYCIDNDNSCNPNKKFDFNNLEKTQGENFTISLALPNNDYDENLPQGVSYIRFFSSDYHKNTEEIQSVALYIDTQGPVIDVEWARLNDSDPFESILSINITTDVESDCSDDILTDAYETPITGDDIIGNLYKTSFNADYFGLEDGLYIYTVNCVDESGNIETVRELIDVDRIQVIYDEFPDTNITTEIDDEERLNNIFTYNTIMFHLKTPSALGTAVCGFYDDTNTWISMDFVGEGPGNSKLHNKSYNVGTNGTYFFPIGCYGGDGNILDTSWYLFTVDRIPPETTLTYTNNYGSHLFNPLAYYITDQTDFYLECDDENLSSSFEYPGEAGCKEIYICDDIDCNSYSVYNGEPIIIENSQDFYYRSVDWKDNFEEVNHAFINIDNQLLNITIDYPLENYMTNIATGHTVDGTWSDDSGLQYLRVVVTNESLFDRISNLSITGNSFSGDLPLLSPGWNVIMVYGWDLAGNDGSDSITVYLDLVGPEFTQEPEVREDVFGVEVQNDNDNYVEWGSNITIEAWISDTQYTALGYQDNTVSVDIDYPDGTWTADLDKLDNENFIKTFEFNQGTLPSSYTEETGTWNITYTTKDRFNNQRILQQWFNVQDNTVPEFIVEILDKNGQQTDLMIRNKVYTINIFSSEPLSKIPSLRYKPLNAADYYEGESVVLFNVQGMYSFTGTTEVPTIGFFNRLDDNENNTRWIMTGTDSHGNTGHLITPELFVIDTRGPEQPKIDNIGLEEYTNNPIFVAGFSKIGIFSIPNQNVTLRSNIVTDNIGVPHNWGTFGSIMSAAQNNAAELNVDIFSIDIENNSVVLDGSRDGSYIEFISYPRFNREYYTITNIIHSDLTYLEFTPDLEEVVSENDFVNLYPLLYPTGWFGFNLNSLTEGNNWIYAVGFDEHGVEGSKAQEEVRNIIYDITSPVITNKYPNNNMILKNNNTNIEITINDADNSVTNVSGIIKSSIELTFNSTSYGCGDAEITCTPSDDFSEEYSIELEPGILGDGDYDVELYMEDRAGNPRTDLWSFTIDQSVPDYPEYSVNSAFDAGYFNSEARSTWYTNDTKFDINSSFNEDISIDSYELSLEGVSKNINISTLENFTLFYFEADRLTDNNYLFEIVAKKIINYTLGRELPDSINIVLDTTAPFIDNVFVRDDIEAGDNFTITSDISEKSPDMIIEYIIKNEDDNIVRQETENVAGVVDPYAFSDQVLALGYGNYTLILTATDTFGEFSSTEILFFVDDTISPTIINTGETITNDPYVEISSNLYDGSGIDWQSIVMRIGETGGIEITGHPTDSGDTIIYNLSSYFYQGTLTYYKNTGDLVYVPGIDLLNGEDRRIYIIYVETDDSIGNTASVTWSVTIDNRIPSPPNVVVGGKTLTPTTGPSDYINYIDIYETAVLSVNFGADNIELSGLSYTFGPNQKITDSTVNVTLEQIYLTLSNLTETPYYFIEVYAETNVGNQVTYRYVFEIDITDPEFLVSTVSYAKQESIPITVVVSEPLDEIDVVVEQHESSERSVSMTNTIGYTWEGDYSVRAGYEGDAVITASGTDAAGNNGEGSTTFIVDTVDPYVMLDDVDTPTNQETVVISGATNGRIVELYVNGVFVEDVIATYDIESEDGVFSIEYNMTLEKIYDFEIVVNDSANNTGLNSTSVLYDETEPEIVNIAPENLTMLANAEIVYAELYDSLSRVDYEASEILLSWYNTTINGTVSIFGSYLRFTPDEGLINGQYIFNVTAVDNAGNIITQTTTFELNNDLPDIQISSPSLPRTYVNEQIFTTTGSVIPGEDKTILYFYINENPINLSENLTDNTFSYDLNLAEEVNELNYIATDSVWLSIKRSKEIIYDITLPSILINNIDTTVSDDYITIIGTFSDNYNVDSDSITITNSANNYTSIAIIAGGDFSANILLENGENPITATIIDRAGNTKSDPITITRDSNAPVISISHPQNNFKTDVQELTITGTATSTYTTDETFVEAVDYDEYYETSDDGVFSLTINLDDGVNYITVEATNPAGLQSSEELEVEYDIVGPEIELDEPGESPMGDHITNNQYTTIKTILTDSSGVNASTIVMELRGMPLTNSKIETEHNITYDLTYSFYHGRLIYYKSTGELIYNPTTDLSRGYNKTTFSVNVSAEDVHGNSNSESWEITIDTRLPSAPLVKLNENIFLDPSVCGTDYVNYVSVSDSADLVVEFYGENIVFDDLSYVFSNMSKRSYQDIDITEKIIKLELGELQEEQYWIEVSVVTNVGNWIMYRYVFEIDETIPEFEISSVEYAKQGLIPINVTASETLGMIDVSVTQNESSEISVIMINIQGYTWEGEYYVTNNDGVAVITASGTDDAGNDGENSTTFIVDTVDPYVILDDIDSPTNEELISITGTTDGVSAELYVDEEFEKDVDVEDGGFSTDYTAVDEKEYEIMIVVSDLSNNFGSSDSKNVIYDITDPEIVSITPANSTMLASVGEIYVKLTDSLSDVDYDSSGISLTGEESITGNLSVVEDNLVFTPNSTLADGVYNVEITVYDLAGNMLEQTSTFEINKEVPGIQISSPLLPTIYVNYQTYTTTGTITATGNKTIISSYLDNNGELTNLSDYMVGDMFNYNITLNPNNNNLMYTATDSVGMSSKVPKQIIYDTVVPLISISNTDTIVPDNSITITGIFSDNYEILGGSILVTNNRNGIPITADLVGDEFSSLITLLDGENIIDATIVDRAGNPNSYPITITMDDGAPNITINYPLNNMKTNIQELTVNGTAISTYSTDGTVVEVFSNGFEDYDITDKSGEFSITFDLVPGINQITVEAENPAGISDYKEVVVEYDIVGPEIELLEPEPIPAGTFQGFTSKFKDIDIGVGTDESSNCEMEKDGGIIIYDFDTLDNLEHYTVYDKQLKPELYLFDITCRDDFNNPTEETLRLKVDQYPPIIESVGAYPNPVLQETEILSEMNASANEVVKCRFILESNLSGYDINDEQGKRDIFNLGTEFDTSNYYSTTHHHNIKEEDLRPGIQGDYVIYILCEDRSGRLSINYETIDLEVNFDWNLFIYEQEPSGTIHELTPELFVTTNYDSTCEVDGYDMASEQIENVYRHSVMLPLQGEADYVHDIIYNYLVECTAANDPSKIASTTVSFTTDYELEAPTITITTPQNGSTFSTTEIYFTGTISSMIEISSAIIVINNNPNDINVLPNNGTINFNISSPLFLFEGLNSFTVTAETELSVEPAEKTHFFTLDMDGPVGEVILEPIVIVPNPEIKIVFNETVNILNATLMNEDTGEYTELSLINNPNNMNFSYVPETLLEQGSYVFVVDAIDSLGNTAETQFNFYVNLTLIVTLIEPEFGVSPTPVFDIVFSTSQDAVCKYDYYTPRNYVDFNDLDTTGTNIHGLTQFNWTDYTKNHAGTFYVACTTEIGSVSGEQGEYELMISVDETIPIINSLTADPSTIIEYIPKMIDGQERVVLLTNLSVVTDEETICKYSDSEVNYNLMEGNFTGYDENDFKTNHKDEIILPYDDEEYNYSAACKNKAGLISTTRFVVIETSTDYGLFIISSGPSGYLVETYITLSVETNKNADCMFYNSLNALIGATTGIKIHTVNVNNLGQGDHSFRADCQTTSDQASTSIGFTIDTTPPVNLTVNDSSIYEDREKTNNNRSLKLQFEAVDPESYVETYYYRLIDRVNTLIFDWRERSNENRFDVTDFGELEDGRYKFQVKATNVLGLNTSVVTSDGITVDTSIVLEIVGTCNDGTLNQDETDIDCGGVCGDCAVGNECDSDEDCSTGYCDTNNTCQTTLCDNNIKDYGETDVDCGGVCVAENNTCDIGDICDIGEDCTSGFCSASSVCIPNPDDIDEDGTINEEDPDTDGDGIPDDKDPDDDNDGKCDTYDSPLNDDTCTGNDPDDDNDGTDDSDDDDTNNDQDDDGTPNDEDDDIDGDGTTNDEDPDDDNDGLCDTYDSPLNDPNVCSGQDDDDDGDGIADWLDEDSDNDADNDGITNEGDDDTDGDGILDDEDSDDDNDGLCDDENSELNDPAVCSGDDKDDDNDGTPDLEEDNDNDGLPDWWEIKNGLNPFVPDSNEIRQETGLTYYEEYIKELEAIKAEEEGVDTSVLDEDEGTSLWVVLLLVFAILGVLVGGGYFGYHEYIKKKEESELKQMSSFRPEPVVKKPEARTVVKKPVQSAQIQKKRDEFKAIIKRRLQEKARRRTAVRGRVFEAFGGVKKPKKKLGVKGKKIDVKSIEKPKKKQKEWVSLDELKGSKKPLDRLSGFIKSKDIVDELSKLDKNIKKEKGKTKKDVFDELEKLSSKSKKSKDVFDELDKIEKEIKK